MKTSQNIFEGHLINTNIICKHKYVMDVIRLDIKLCNLSTVDPRNSISWVLFNTEELYSVILPTDDHSCQEVCNLRSFPILENCKRAQNHWVSGLFPSSQI
jgi:hypothetical protein